MTTFREFLQESINDKGAFKAIFVLGIPGAGKSYTIKHLSGQVQPRIVNTDKAAEYLSARVGKAITSGTWGEFKDDSIRITKASLSNYINGVLPLFIDGTSNDASNLLHRMGILESLGYDVGIVHIKTSLQTAIKRANVRAEKIGRHVDKGFIRDVHSRNDKNMRFLKTKVSFFRQINNEDMQLDDETLLEAFRKTQGFFLSPIKNPIGQRLMQKMKDEKQSYLSPNIVPKEVLDRKIDGWYK